jgi:hypothetical protein
MNSITKGRKMLLTVFGMLALILIFLPAKSNARSEEHSRTMTTTSFRMLDEHGEWIENSRFGRVWRPYAVSTWRPFVYGEWDWTDDGWFWDSYEPFGWVVYHYGYWAYVDDTGWVWIPGYDYSPARVSWIDFDDYIGWAPLPPPGFPLPDPWAVQTVVYWNIVSIHEFHSHEIDKHIITAHVPQPKDVDRIARKAPEVGKIETASNSKIEKIKMGNANVKEGKESLRQVKIPKDHARLTQPFRDRIKSQILVPKMARHH